MGGGAPRRRCRLPADAVCAPGALIHLRSGSSPLPSGEGPGVRATGGPADSTEVLSTYLYKQVFSYLDVGYGAAVAVIMAMIIAAVR